MHIYDTWLLKARVTLALVAGTSTACPELEWWSGNARRQTSIICTLAFTLSHRAKSTKCANVTNGCRRAVLGCILLAYKK